MVSKWANDLSRFQLMIKVVDAELEVNLRPSFAHHKTKHSADISFIEG